ncbi:MAG: hypothetical protein AAB638_00340 [Patescibacteria group bacterium]
MSLFQRKIFSVGLILFAVLLWRSVWQIKNDRSEATSQIKDFEVRIADLERANQFLASSSAYFSSDAYLERQARLKLNYKLPDERVAFIYKDTSTKVTPQAEEFKNSLSDMPNWKKWWYYLFGY